MYMMCFLCVCMFVSGMPFGPRLYLCRLQCIFVKKKKLRDLPEEMQKK